MVRIAPIDRCPRHICALQWEKAIWDIFILDKSRLKDGLNYSIHQERYLKAFLGNGEIPIDNSASERAIRPFCVGRSNWHMIDTVKGAEASAIVYSIVETAKANNQTFRFYFVVPPVRHDFYMDSKLL